VGLFISKERRRLHDNTNSFSPQSKPGPLMGANHPQTRARIYWNDYCDLREDQARVEKLRKETAAAFDAYRANKSSNLLKAHVELEYELGHWEWRVAGFWSKYGLMLLDHFRTAGGVIR
jgi:hypothetical protein